MTERKSRRVQQPGPPEPDSHADRYRTEIARKEARRARAREEKRHGLWFGVGMFGLVGWSVAIPTVLGVALGMFLDRTRPVAFSWTLTGLIVGVAVGCLNAWYWVKREGRLR